MTMSDDNKYEVLKEEERSMEDSVARTSDRDFIVEGSEDVGDVDILTLGAGARVPIFNTSTRPIESDEDEKDDHHEGAFHEQMLEIAKKDLAAGMRKRAAGQGEEESNSSAGNEGVVLRDLSRKKEKTSGGMPVGYKFQRGLNVGDLNPTDSNHSLSGATSLTRSSVQPAGQRGKKGPEEGDVTKVGKLAGQFALGQGGVTQPPWNETTQAAFSKEHGAPEKTFAKSYEETISKPPMTARQDEEGGVEMEWESYDEEEWDRSTQKQDMNWEECGRTLIKESSECGAQVHAGLEMLKEYWERRNEHLKAGGQGEIATVRREAIQEYGNGEGLTRMMLFDESEKEAMQFTKQGRLCSQGRGQD